MRSQINQQGSCEDNSMLAHGAGPRLKVGMVLALEPMVNEGTWRIRLLDDEWTAVTADGKLSAHFENSVAITEEGPYILSEK